MKAMWNGRYVLCGHLLYTNWNEMEFYSNLIELEWNDSSCARRVLKMKSILSATCDSDEMLHELV